MIIPLDQIKPFDRRDKAEIPTLEEIKRCINEKQKIMLIKYFRYAYNVSLIDAKDTIENALNNDDGVFATLTLFVPIWKYYRIRNDFTCGDLVCVLLDKIEYAMLGRDKMGITDNQLIELIHDITKNHILNVKP